MSTRPQILMRERSAGPFGKPAIALSVAIVALLIVTGQAFAQDCDTAQDPVEYDSSDGLRPEETVDWVTDCPGDQDGVAAFGSIVDGVLVVNDTSITAKAKYCVENIFLDKCDPRQDAVYEFSCRALEVATNANQWLLSTAELVYACGISTGSNGSVDDDIRVAVTLNEGVGFWKTTGENSDWLKIDGVDQRVDISLNGAGEWADFHVFRIEKHSDPLVNEVRLFLDNEATPTLAFDLDLLPNNNLDDLTLLASTSNPGRSKFELLHFRYRLGTTEFGKPPPDCLADFNEDGTVGASDLLQLLAAWGPCAVCVEDIDNNGTVGASDLLILLASWGPCP